MNGDENNNDDSHAEGWLVPAAEAQPSTTTPLSSTDNRKNVEELWLAGRSPATVEAYRRDLRAFAAFLVGEGARRGEDVGAVVVERLIDAGHGQANAIAHAYRAHMLDKLGLAPSTVNRRLSALRSLLKLARTLGVISWALDVPAVKSKRYRDTRGPGRSGARALLEAIAGDKPKAIRDRAIVRLLFDCALRRGEVVSLDLEHAELPQCSEGGEARVWIRGKGAQGDEREAVTLPDPTRDAVRAWVDVRGELAGPLFLSMDPARKGGRATLRARCAPARSTLRRARRH